MTDRAPIPVETFDAAVDRLDRDALAAFVGRLEAAADGTAGVEVDPPIVTVDDGDDRDRILIAPGGSDADTDRPEPTGQPPDVVVVGPDSTAGTSDGSVRTAADLRHQLLYAVSPAAAESIAEEWLDTPARSASYAPDPTPAAVAGGSADGDGTAAGSGPDAGTSDDSTASVVGASAADGAAGRRSGPTPEGRDGLGPGDERSGAAVTRSSAGIAVGAVLVGVILAVTGGVVYAAEVSTDGDAGAFAAPGPVDTEGLSDAEIRRGSRDLIDESGAVATGTATPTPEPGSESDGRPLVDDTETDRNVRPAPTCGRSFLHVVQIQMNALKYNNNTTDDGIRTVRRFASPRNRQTIRTFDQFVRVIENPTYSPMLSHDSAQYTPVQSSDDDAQVYVTTRETGNVTGQYTFRLRKIDGGEYEGCWMTDAVVSVPEATTFSAEVTGRNTDSPNGTS
ncbi:hypothetical protein GCM10008995_06290 [Halobellus salinus]|uniref:DUF4864 domain-containing protein n=1 Tax=Halobellus salinus TaxID=931585 RepID=A0A830EDB0_9EURY|nr:hypothetical protein [Halobellus salinus]GGI99150.1 hypothetical protein GCM10008995_06290 [Halobellus salinus]SMP05030.1 hypothetical protein SAMN06265347_10246 [Halobellus salinus]